MASTPFCMTPTRWPTSGASATEDLGLGLGDEEARLDGRRGAALESRAGARPRAGTARTWASADRRRTASTWPNPTSQKSTTRRREPGHVEVLRHRPGEGHRRADALLRHHLLAPSAPGAGCGSTAGSAPRRAAGRAGWRRGRMPGSIGITQVCSHHWRQGRDVATVVRMIDEAAQPHPVRAGELAQDVERPHLVALVGRIGDAVREVEERRPAVLAPPYPRLRTMCGPSRLATPIGRRFQRAMKARYLGFIGLFCGMLSRLYRRYS